MIERSFIPTIYFKTVLDWIVGIMSEPSRPGIARLKFSFLAKDFKKSWCSCFIPSLFILSRKDNGISLTPSCLNNPLPESPLTPPQNCLNASLINSDPFFPNISHESNVNINVSITDTPRCCLSSSRFFEIESKNSLQQDTYNFAIK
ncbi:hypothetical protein AYI70_g6384 [Smittium culicis]|uniref:Uncharacterized protein n=1 Tax=Smittium culicis TaxID=133412 RepID=A0A1R1XQ82_9FUNG|nr:hypothetical protein AYI70_g6384 [Smittium culicis]